MLGLQRRGSESWRPHRSDREKRILYTPRSSRTKKIHFHIIKPSFSLFNIKKQMQFFGDYDHKHATYPTLICRKKNK